MFFAFITAAFTMCLNLCHIRSAKARLSWRVKLSCSRSWQNHNRLIHIPSAWRYAGKRELVTYSNDTLSFHFINSLGFSKAGILVHFMPSMTALHLQNGSLFLSCSSTSFGIGCGQLCWQPCFSMVSITCSADLYHKLINVHSGSPLLN
jgi:hypothetical protein